MPTYTYVYVYSSALTGEGNLPPNFDQSRAFRRCGKVVTVTLIERAFRSRVFHRSRSFEGGFATRNGRRRGGTVRDLEYDFQTTVPIETADQPDPHFPQLTDGPRPEAAISTGA